MAGLTPQLLFKLILMCGGLILLVIVAVAAMSGRAQAESSGCLLFLVAVAGIALVLMSSYGLAWGYA